MLNQDFQDMLDALVDERVDFLLVGAFALAFHGYVRATGDIDLWVRPDRANATRTIAALRRFGAPLMGLTEADLSTPGNVFQIGLPPKRIDILTSISGVEFEEAWTTRTTISLNGRDIHVLSRAHLIQNKQATGRLKDSADAEWLIEHQDD